MIEEVASAADVEAFWSDCQDGGGKTFTLPAGDANDTDVIPSATDAQSGPDALPALVAALAKVTAERDRARDRAALLESRLARVTDGIRLLLSDLSKCSPAEVTPGLMAVRVRALSEGPESMCEDCTTEDGA